MRTCWGWLPWCWCRDKGVPGVEDREEDGEVSNFPLAADTGVRHGMATLCSRRVISPDLDLLHPMYAQVRKITRTLTFCPPEIQTGSRPRPYGNGLAIPDDPVPK